MNNYIIFMLSTILLYTPYTAYASSQENGYSIGNQPLNDREIYASRLRSHTACENIDHSHATHDIAILAKSLPTNFLEQKMSGSVPREKQCLPKEMIEALSRNQASEPQTLKTQIHYDSDSGKNSDHDDSDSDDNLFLLEDV